MGGGFEMRLIHYNGCDISILVFSTVEISKVKSVSFTGYPKPKKNGKDRKVKPYTPKNHGWSECILNSFLIPHF